MRDVIDELVTWVTGPASDEPLQRVEAQLLPKLMSLGVLLVSAWVAHRLLSEVANHLQRGRGWFLFTGLTAEPVRSRFGVGFVRRPQYVLRHGEGPTKVAPFDREIGLAAGRMSLGVHLTVSLR